MGRIMPIDDNPIRKGSLITQDILEEYDAGEEMVSRFSTLFPDGMILNEENLTTCGNGGCNQQWFCLASSTSKDQCKQALSACDSAYSTCNGQIESLRTTTSSTCTSACSASNSTCSNAHSSCVSSCSAQKAWESPGDEQQEEKASTCGSSFSSCSSTCGGAISSCGSGINDAKSVRSRSCGSAIYSACPD